MVRRKTQRFLETLFCSRELLQPFPVESSVLVMIGFVGSRGDGIVERGDGLPLSLRHQ